MRRNQVAVVGAAETTELGVIPNMSQIQLHADAALNAIAVVELEEGPRMMTNIVECPQTPEALQLDMPLEVVFEKQNDDITLPFFRPAVVPSAKD